MPLLRRRKSYNKGDIVVYYFLGFFADDGGVILSDMTDIIPVCSLILGVYKGIAYRSDWTPEDGEFTSMLIHAKEIASCDFVMGEAKGDLTIGTYRTYIEYVDPEWILGSVCGTIDLKDPYAIQAYLGLVWKKHYSIFEQAMEDSTYQRLTAWDGYDS